MNEIKQLYFNKLKISFLKSYIQNHIKKLKKLQKKYIQIGGKEKEQISINQIPTEPIRIPIASTFYEDGPNIILRSIGIFNNTSDLFEIGQCLAEKYDENGNFRSFFLIINEGLGFIKIFIRSYSFFIKMFKGQFNEKILKAIQDFENSLLEDIPDEKLSPQVSKFIEQHKKAHEIMVGGSTKGNVEVTPEQAHEMAAFLTSLKMLVNEMEKSGKVITRDVLPDVLSRKVNPIQEINNTISDSIRSLMDVGKAIPGVGAIVSIIAILDKVTKNVDRVLNIFETIIEIAQQIVKKNVIKTSDGKCSMPLLDSILAVGKLSNQSPEVARLLKSVGIEILEDGVKNSLKPSEDFLDMNNVADYFAQDAIQTLKNSSDRHIQDMEKNKADALDAISSQDLSNTAPASGGRKKSPKKKKSKKKRKKRKKGTRKKKSNFYI